MGRGRSLSCADGRSPNGFPVTLRIERGYTMKITLQEVEHVARLARLELTAEEKERMRAQLDSILSYIDTLNELDTSAVEPTSHVLPMTNVFLEDEVSPSLAQEAALAKAPDRHDLFFRVPRILEE